MFQLQRIKFQKPFEQSGKKVRRGTELVDQIRGVRKGYRGVCCFLVIAHNKLPQTGAFQHRNAFSLSSGGQISENKLWLSSRV